MPETKLNSDEADVLRSLLQSVVVRLRTGEVGIEHGANRFVGTALTLKAPERGVLDAIARKVGLGGVRTRAD